MKKIKDIIKNVFSNKKLLFIVISIIIIIIVISMILIFKGKHYSDTDYLIIDNKGTLIGFSEYNETKDMLVKYNNKGERTKDTYSKKDTLIVLVKKENKEVVTLPKEVKSIKKGLFINAEYINTIKIDMDINKIEDEMFMNSTFKKIILNDNIKSIGKRAFMNNVYLKEVEGKVENIDTSAFENDVSLKNINLKGAKEIGDNAFKGCNSIKKIYISKNITSVGRDAFKYMGNNSIIYTENFKTKLMVEGKYTLGKTTVTIDNKYFK